MSEVHIIAYVSPSEGNSARVEELLRGMTQKVHSKEPNTTRYHLHRELNSSNPELVMTETYKSQADADAHLTSDDFKSFAKTLQEEKLLSGPPKIITCESLAGFESREKGLF